VQHLPKALGSAKFLAANETVFVYEFGYSTAPIEGLACHGCEISDVFNISDVSAFHFTDAQAKEMQASYAPRLGDAMSRYWANFIKTGNPDGAPSWGKYAGDIHSAKQLHIATDSAGQPRLSVDSGLDADKCEFFHKFARHSEANNLKFANFCNSPAPLSSTYQHSDIVV